MPLKLAWPVCLVLMGACASTQARAPKFGAFGLDLEAGDRTVRPGDDFDRYANGHWLETTTLRSDQAGVSVFDALRGESEERLKTLVDELKSRTDLAPGSPEQKIRDLFASVMNRAGRDAAGIAPLQGVLARYAAIESMSALATAFGRADVDGSNAPIGVGLLVDRKDPTQYLVTVSVFGLGLPDRDHYLNDDAHFQTIRQAYQKHIALMLGFARVADAQAQAEAMVALETALAQHLWSAAERRDHERTHNVMSYAELTARYPGFDWDALFAAQGLPRAERVNVSTPSAVGPVIALIRETPLATWRAWLTYHALNGNASTLSHDIEAASFDFYGKVVEGQPAQRDEWRRAIEWVSDRWGLGEELGRLYVARFFHPESKRVMEAMVNDLRLAMGDRLEHADWLGPTTREEALRKLRALRTKVGYPDRWRDVSSVTIGPDDLPANARALRQYRVDDMVRRAGTTPDRDEWRMTPQTPNAYHFGPFNELVFPAAILQPPLFDPAADPAVNYGAVGAFIGHEMGHAFDDQGAKADHAGLLRNWWSDADRERFHDKARQLGAQLMTYCPRPGQCVKPELAMGESIADLAGVSTAYAAYHASLHGQPAPVLGGLTGDQRFFLSFAQMWRTLKRDEALLRQLTDDPHPPAKYRINGALRNLDAWYEAFDVRPGDLLYVAPEQRVRLW